MLLFLSFSFFIFAGAKIIQVRSVLEHCCSLCAKRTQARGRKPGCKACGWQHQRSLLREGQGRLTKYVQTPTLALPRPHPPHCGCVGVCVCVSCLGPFSPFPFPCFPCFFLSFSLLSFPIVAAWCQTNRCAVRPPPPFSTAWFTEPFTTDVKA